MIRLGSPADLVAVTDVYCRASLSNPSDRDRLLAHPEYLVMGPEGLIEGRTYVAVENGSVVGFATWSHADGATSQGAAELEDLFVDPAWTRRGIASALVNRVVEAVGANGARNLEVTANSDALPFYQAVGFIDSGIAETEAGSAPRMKLTLG